MPLRAAGSSSPTACRVPAVAAHEKRVLASTLETTERLGGLLAGATVGTAFGGGFLATQLHQVSKVLSVHGTLGLERLSFLTRQGGYDTHFDDGETMIENLDELDSALSAFATELKRQKLWNNVTVVTVSDFGRTLTSNGRGTDHGWGGNNFVFGGAVRGGRMLGHFPESLVTTGADTASGGNRTILDVGRGRLIPTTPWEAMWKALAQWMGVESAQMGAVLPNIQNFPPHMLFNASDVFVESGGQR